MAAALIIPTSILGFITALLRMLAFNASLAEAAITYFVVCAVAPAIILWVVKTSDLRRADKSSGALATQ
jgi:hypothetical protein